MATQVEVCLALLAAFGLLSLGWMVFQQMLIPTHWDSHIYTVIPASGDGRALEQTVKSFLWVHRSHAQQLVLLIADCGLDDEGQQLARLLTQNPTVLLCPVEDVSLYLR